MDDYMSELDANKPPLTGTELRLRLDGEDSRNRLKQERERLRTQLIQIITGALADANVMRAVDEVELLFYRQPNSRDWAQRYLTVLSIAAEHHEPIRSLEFPDGSPADAGGK